MKCQNVSILSYVCMFKYNLGIFIIRIIQSVLWNNDSHNQISIIFSRYWRIVEKVENSINFNVQFAAIGCRKPQGTH